MTKEASNRIYWIRFICAMMVVGIHSENGIVFQLPADSMSWKIQAWIANNIYCVAVPIFFILSGFFCFYHKDEKQIMEKYRSRILKTAYLYLLWNMIYMCYHYLKEIVAEGGRISINPVDIFKGIFLYEYNNPWWFMLQLLLLEVMTPVFLYAMRNKKNGFIMLLLCLAISLIADINGISNPYIRLDALAWYAFGIYAGRYMDQLLLQEEKRKWTPWLCILLGEIALYASMRGGDNRIRCLPILVLAVGFFKICEHIEKTIPKIWKETFFMYAIHPLLLGILQQMEAKIITVKGWISLLLFVLNPFAVILIISVIVWLIGKTRIYHILVAESKRG